MAITTSNSISVKPCFAERDLGEGAFRISVSLRVISDGVPLLGTNNCWCLLLFPVTGAIQILPAVQSIHSATCGHSFTLPRLGSLLNKQQYSCAISLGLAACKSECLDKRSPHGNPRPCGDPVLLFRLKTETAFWRAHRLGGGFESRKNADPETGPPTVPSVVGRQALGIKVHFNNLPIFVG